MATRTARTTWAGGLQDGSGRVELTSSGLDTFDVNFPRRAAETADGYTSPEELVAAAHSSCYAMQLSGLIAAKGTPASDIQVQADVTLGPDKPGFKLTKIQLTVKAKVDGMDDATFQQVAADAKATCPVSKALTGVPISLDASLED